MKIEVGQEWIDNKTGNTLIVLKKRGDKWQCMLKASKTPHKMNEYIIKKYYCFNQKQESRPSLRSLLIKRHTLI